MSIIKPIKVFETFSGIGAQHKAISNSGTNFEIKKTCEWDARATIAYSRIHYGNYNADLVLQEKGFLKEEDVNLFFIDKQISLDSKKPGRITQKNTEFKKELLAAILKTNNKLDITLVKGEEIKDIDLITYSFPCQGLSIANMGRGQGIDPKANSTSNLIWQIYRILNEARDNKQQLPKYLLMENVSALLNKKHISHYNEWNRKLEKDFGYKTFYFVLNAYDFGMPQKRKRVFAISILNPIKKWTQEKFEEIIDNQKVKIDIKNMNKKIKEILSIQPRNKNEEEEFIQAYVNNTKSRLRMVDECRNLDPNNNLDYLNTLTTKQDRIPNIGMVPITKKEKGKCSKRLITPREAYLIMGFDDNDFNNVRPYWLEKNILTKESLYRQAGNSIAVGVLEGVFKTIEEIERQENEKNK